MSAFRLTVFQIRQLLRTPFFVQQAVLAPVAFIALRFLSGSASPAGIDPETWLDASIAGFWASTTTAVGIVGFQRFQGTLEHLVMSTRSPAVVFGGLSAAAALVGLIGIPVSAVAQLVLGREIVLSAGHIVSLALATCSCTASAAALAAIFVVMRGGTAIESLLVTPVWLLCGVVVPLSRVPAWAVPMAVLHPLTGAVAVGHSESLAASWGWILQSIALSVFWLLAAGRFLAIAVRRARSAGSLALA